MSDQVVNLKAVKSTELDPGFRGKFPFTVGRKRNEPERDRRCAELLGLKRTDVGHGKMSS